MPSITLDRFDGGLLLARPTSVAPANSLSAVRNMEVQPGGWLRSRPKWRPASDVLTIAPQWKGLESNVGYLWVFSCWNVASTGKVSDIVNTDTGERVVYAFYSSGTGGNFNDAARAMLLGVTRWDSGFVAVVSPDNGTTCYLVRFTVNTSTHTVTATNIADVNGPKSGKMVTATGRIYAISDDGLSVKFCKVGDTSDWTAAGDAGSLPVAQHFGSGQRAYGLGLYQGKLAVFTDKSIQLWIVDPDPTAMELERVVDGVGTRHHKSIVSLNGDLMFQSETGIRSLTTLSNALFPTDVDLGLPIQRLTVSPTALTRFVLGSFEPSVMALAATPFGQYWVSAPGRWSL